MHPARPVVCAMTHECRSRLSLPLVCSFVRKGLRMNERMWFVGAVIVALTVIEALVKSIPRLSSGETENMDYFSLLQWPAMIINVLAVWLLTYQSKRKRHAGFVCSLFSNALWVAWGWHVQAFAVIGLQFALATLNIHGVRKTD